VNPNNHHS